jgi:hypothetical protein
MSASCQNQGTKLAIPWRNREKTLGLQARQGETIAIGNGLARAMSLWEEASITRWRQIPAVFQLFMCLGVHFFVVIPCFLLRSVLPLHSLCPKEHLFQEKSAGVKAYSN